MRGVTPHKLRETSISIDLVLTAILMAEPPIKALVTREYSRSAPSQTVRESLNSQALPIRPITD